MQITSDTKNRPSESSSSDSGIMMDDSLLCTDGELKISSTVHFTPSQHQYDNDNNDVKVCNIQNGGEKINCTLTTDHSTKVNNSPESTHISIESIDENAIDSSVIDSDSDFDDIPTNGDFIIEKLGQHMNANDAKNGIIIFKDNQVDKLSPNSTITACTATPRAQIGSIAVQNSSDITFGDKTFYQGPVKIQQFLLENNKWRPKDSNGNVNGGFDGSGIDDKSNRKDIEQSSKNKFILNAKTLGITGGIIFVIFLIAMIVLSIILLGKSKLLSSSFGDGEDSRINNPVSSTIGKDNIGAGQTLRYISRAEWVAQPPIAPINDLELPAKRVIIAHTATESCESQASCTFHVRYLQTFNLESENLDDIKYNFLVGGDGAVYEGRGWDKEGAHTKGFNTKSICIAFIGTFINIGPPDRQLNVTKLLIEDGVQRQKIASDYQLFGQRQLISSESPGKMLYKQIQKWPHWFNDTTDN